MSRYQKLRDALRRSGRTKFNPERRNFGKVAAAGMLGAYVLPAAQSSAAQASDQATGSIAGDRENTSNVKLSAMSQRRWATEETQLDGFGVSVEYLAYVKQIGLQYVIVRSPGNGASQEHLLHNRKAIEAAGLKAPNVGIRVDHTTILNLEGRDEKVEELKAFIRNASAAGYHTVWSHYSSSSIWNTGREMIRGASGRAFDLEKARGKGYQKSVDRTWYADRPSHGRVYSEQEIWDNFTYFIKALVPVLEETGVRLAFHPDDPPMPELGGVPRIFSSFDRYQRAFEIADSPNVGIYLGVGSYIEGGTGTGKDILDVIRIYGEQNKIFKVDFRNVSAPLPHFIETFPDNGYVDMYKVMRALVEVNNHCVVCDDHVPRVTGGRRVADAYTYGYMRALLERALDEVKEGDRPTWPDTYAV